MAQISDSEWKEERAFSRRRFFSTAAGVAAASLWPGALRAAPSRSRASSIANGRLVLIKLEGGNDALNTLFPRDNDTYRRARPKLAQQGGVALDDAWALHTAMEPLRAIWDAGELALFPGLGYPQPDRSHFRSMEIWESARPSRVDLTSGWIGRGLDVLWERDDARGPLACALGSTRLPISLLARHAQSACARDVEQLAGDFELSSGATDLMRALQSTDAASSEAVRTWLAARERLRAMPANKTEAKTPFARDLHGIARLIRADLGARVFHASMSGFDTHARQADVHAALLGELAKGLVSFAMELKKSGHYADTAVLVFSEFGRRVRENGSLGTDHGAGGLALLCGGRVQGGFHSPHVSLEDLDNGDLRHTMDFRTVYGVLLREVLGVDDAELLAISDTLPRIFAPA